MVFLFVAMLLFGGYLMLYLINVYNFNYVSTPTNLLVEDIYEEKEQMDIKNKIKEFIKE